MSESRNGQDLDFSNTAIAFSNKTNKELKSAVRLFKMMNSPALVNLGSKFGMIALKLRLPFARRAVKATIFRQFVGGETLLESQPVIDQLNKFKVATILDYGAESKSSEEDLNKTVEETLKAIKFAASNESVPVVSTKITGLADNDLLIKMQSETALSSGEAHEKEQLIQRLETICGSASELGVGVFIDAEESWMQDTIDVLAETLMQKYNQGKVVVYNTFQMYRHDRLAYLKKMHAHANQHGYLLGAKLVRGAYMDKERAKAAAEGYPSPIQMDKASTDRDFNEALHFCVERYEKIAICNASHNLESNKLLADLIADKNIQRNHPHLNFCQLLGMSDHITYNLADAGYNVAKYVPYGSIGEVVPYLIRRAKENSSVTGDMSRELGIMMEEMQRRDI